MAKTSTAESDSTRSVKWSMTSWKLITSSGWTNSGKSGWPIRVDGAWIPQVVTPEATAARDSEARSSASGT
ncbi:MAG: hypothetical protein R2691_10345 [Solirubrobacterales bacterium]